MRFSISIITLAFSVLMLAGCASSGSSAQGAAMAANTTAAVNNDNPDYNLYDENGYWAARAQAAEAARGVSGGGFHGGGGRR